MFDQYLKLGWKLCKIEPSTKGPRQKNWNRRENALTNLTGVVGAGLLHAYSGTCALDVDNIEEARKILPDLDALFAAPDAVQLSSGRANRGKLIYRLESPMPSRSWGSFELRCGTSDGLSVQDVLPPTQHPDTGKPYFWVGDYTKIPLIPESLRQFWRANLSQPTVVKSDKKQTADLAELKALLSKRSPDCGYEEWRNTGMILNHECQGSAEGLALWDEWSAPGKTYPGYEELAYKWSTFGNHANPLTADSWRHQDVADDSEFKPVTPPAADFMAEPKRTNPFLGLSLERHEWGNLPKPSWLIPGLLPERGLGCIWGPSGSGKSFLGIDLASAIATGSRWRGLSVKQGTVCAIVAEDAYGFRRRVEAALDARGLSRAPVKVLEATTRLQEKQQLDWMLEEFSRYGKISLILVDTMAAATPGIDENSTKDVTAFLASIRRLENAFSCMTMMIHHSGKDASRGARGSSAYHGSFDVEWEIEHEKHALLRKMNLAKIRNAPIVNKQGEPFEHPFTLTEANDSCVVEWL